MFKPPCMVYENCVNPRRICHTETCMGLGATRLDSPNEMRALFRSRRRRAASREIWPSLRSWLKSRGDRSSTTPSPRSAGTRTRTASHSRGLTDVGNADCRFTANVRRCGRGLPSPSNTGTSTTSPVLGESSRRELRKRNWPRWLTRNFAKT